MIRESFGQDLRGISSASDEDCKSCRSAERNRWREPFIKRQLSVSYERTFLFIACAGAVCCEQRGAGRGRRLAFHGAR
eukprot:2615394-Pleurochrysis_carterae.AAC.2